MKGRRHIEDLRDMLDRLRHDAVFLYQYGTPASSVDLFDSLSPGDRKRLLYLALIEGDKDVRNVANYLMRTLCPAPRDREELLAQMSPEDKAELVELAGSRPSGRQSLTVIGRRRTAERLREACERIGFLEVERAFWILVPEDAAEEALWVEAAGGKEGVLSETRSDFHHRCSTIRKRKKSTDS